MSGQDKGSMFEGLSAELQAADPADQDTLVKIADELTSAARLLDSGSAVEILATTARQTLQRVAGNDRPDSAAALVRLAEAMMAIAQYLQDGDVQNKALIGSSIDDLVQELQSTGSSFSDMPLQAELSTKTSSEAHGPSRSQQDSGQIEGDQELLGDFVAEALEHVATAESALLALERDADDLEQVNTVLRAFHTIKGASAFLGLDQIHNLAHLAENLLARARDGEIRILGQYADLALQSCDTLKGMLADIQTGQDGSACRAPDGLNELLRKLSDPQASAGQAVASENPDSVLLAAHPTEAESPPIEKQSTDSRITDGAEQKKDSGQTERTSGQHADSTIRVATKRLDDMVDMVGELVIAQSMISQSPEISQSKSRQFIRSISHAGKIVRELQDLAMSLRMVPLKSMFAKMHRLTRDLARKSDKSVRLVTSGDTTEIDRNMVETLTDPLVHMIRNAVDHGIESSQQRSQRGKEAAGTIFLRAYHTAGNVVIEVEDDGKGLDTERIAQKAVERGLTPPNSELTNEQALSLIFQPGFSTVEKVSEVSGRGVGMDVVRRNIARLRGRVGVSSQPGCGTTFRLCLPLTTAIADAILVRVGSERFLLPTMSIERSFRPEADSISYVAQSGEVVMFRGELLPVFRLHELFDIDGAATDPHQALLVVITGSGRRCALMVDELLSHQQAVIKSLGKASEDVQGTAGGAILGDGRVALILDTDGLINLALGLTSGYALAGAGA